MAKIPEVLIIDQDKQSRFEAKQLVKRSQFNVSGEAGFGTEAVSLALESKPDLVLCAMSEPVARSLQTVDSLLNALPETPIIVYSTSRDIELARRAMLAGARDFLTVPASAQDVSQSIIAVLEAEERRRMRATGQTTAWGPRGSIITVFGAKGGVGKTTIAVNLAVAMALETTQSVVLVDGDSGFGDVASMLDLTPDRTITDLVRDSATVTRESLSGYLAKHSSGLAVLPAPADALAWREITPDDFRRVLELLSKSHDVVIVDTAGLLNEMTLAALEDASLILSVVATDFSSVRDTLRAMEALRNLPLLEENFRVVVNGVATVDGVRPQTVEEVLQQDAVSRIPFDKRVRHGSQTGEPVVIGAPKAPGARSLMDLARKIAGIRSSERGLLSRLRRRPDDGEQTRPPPEFLREETTAQ